jgi:hypothetical protein
MLYSVVTGEVSFAGHLLLSWYWAYFQIWKGILATQLLRVYFNASRLRSAGLVASSLLSKTKLWKEDTALTTKQH